MALRRTAAVCLAIVLSFLVQAEAAPPDGLRPSTSSSGIPTASSAPPLGFALIVRSVE